MAAGGLICAAAAAAMVHGSRVATQYADASIAEPPHPLEVPRNQIDFSLHCRDVAERVPEVVTAVQKVRARLKMAQGSTMMARWHENRVLGNLNAVYTRHKAKLVQFHQTDLVQRCMDVILGERGEGKSERRGWEWTEA